MLASQETRPIYFSAISRKSHPKFFYEKDVLKSFPKFKKPVSETLLNKVAGLQLATLLKRGSDTCVLL